MKIKNISKGMIHRSMKKYRRKFLLTELLLMVILACYFIGCYEYISNVFVGAVPMDGNKFAIETTEVPVPETVEIHRNDSLEIPSYALKGDSYWQDNKYEFSVELKNVEKTDIFYRNSDTQTGSEENADVISSYIYTAYIGGKKVLITAYPHHDLKDGQTVEGIFTAIPLVIYRDMAESSDFETGEEICEYMLDIRGLEMESEFFDVTFCIVMLLIIAALGIKLAIQYNNYLKTPTYRQLDKYGDIKTIEKQIEDEATTEYTIDGNEIITENWIISEDTFKLKIVKNHRTHGKFNYLPQK